jgi:hypothetical protein
MVIVFWINSKPPQQIKRKEKSLNEKKDETIEVGDLVKPKGRFLLHGLGVVTKYHGNPNTTRSYEVFWCKKNMSTRASYDELLVVARKRRATTL